MEGYLITLKKNRIKLTFGNKNSISIKQIKEKLQEKYGYDKSYTKIMKNEEDNRELPNDSSVSNNFKLYLKNIKYIKFSYEQMQKSSSSNFRNYCIFENEEYHYSNSNRDIRKYNSNYNDYSILQKKKTFEDEIQNYDLSLTHDNKNDFYNYYDNNYENYNENYNDNYGNNKSDKNIPSASNRDNLEFSLIKNNSDKDINTENKNNSNSNSNNNSNNNFIKGQYENDSNVIIGENDNDLTFSDSDISELMSICGASRERVIQALKQHKGNLEGAADSIFNNAI